MNPNNTSEKPSASPAERGRDPAAGAVLSLGFVDRLVRVLVGSVVTTTILFLINNYLIFWQGWPGVVELLSHYQGLGAAASEGSLDDAQLSLAWLQLGSYLAGILVVAIYVGLTPRRGLRRDARLFGGFAAYVVRGAFWTVLLVGLADMLISWLRVEELLTPWLSDALIQELGRPQFRGAYVHYPLVLLAFVIALFSRSLGFTWLALLVVIAEFQIVIFRFVFSYEQAFMGDLVRFWYAALFLFASAHTLVIEGHVRVDVLYTHFSQRMKAWSNTLGLLFLGLPLCWVILVLGMWNQGSSIISPLLSFEISQSGYGMYTKYLMVAFLVVFAFSMMVQFCSYLLSNIADLRNEPGRDHPAVSFSH